MRRRLGSNMNIGASSLLLIFIVLSLITFAVLSLSSALSDKQLMSDTIENTTEYYEACNNAELKISTLIAASDADSYEEYEWDEPIGSDGMQVLHVCVGINSAEGTYTVTSWKVVNVEIPELDVYLNLL